MIAIKTLTTTPVKGTALHLPETLELGPHGVQANRRFHLIDERGLMVNGKRRGVLVTVRAHHSAPDAELTLTFPDGTVVAGEVPVEGQPVLTDFYGRPVPGRVVEGPWAAPLSRLLGLPVRLVEAERPGDAVDVHPVTVISTASLAAVAEHPLDARRFRMLVEVDGCEAFAEDGWVGRTIELGDARVRVEGPVPRCAVTTQDPDSGRVDLPVLRMLLDRRGALLKESLDTPVDHLPDRDKVCLGVYGTVERPARVHVGDPVSLPDPVSTHNP